MKVRCLISILFLPFLCSFSGAQSISRAVITIAGTTSTESGRYISWSAGEPVVSTGFANMHFLTQGFQQPSLINPGLSLPEDIDAVDVFPNPVARELTVSFRIRELTTYFVNIYDVTGRLLLAKKFENLSSQDKYLDFSAFSKGLFFVHVYSSERKMDRVFKIEKL